MQKIAMSSKSLNTPNHLNIPSYFGSANEQLVGKYAVERKVMPMESESYSTIRLYTFEK